MKWILLSLNICIALAHFSALAKDTPEETCKEAAKLYADGDLEGALEEAKWCVSQMEQEKQQQVTKMFPDNIDGFVGEPLEQQGVMGFTVMSRTYKKGDTTVKVMLNGGTGGSALQAFSAIAQLGLQAGTGEKIRIQKRAAMVTQEGNQTKVIITMRSGGILTFESAKMSSENLANFAKKFPVSDLDDAIG
ncbi:MAG: hypothetical protein ACI88A_004638 [Paraglaciecola sp.]|jgi:hypothetical protein